MKILLLTPVRLLGDGLYRAINQRTDIYADEVVGDLSALRACLSRSGTEIDAVLVDVTQGLESFDIRMVATEWPRVMMVALGLPEQRQEVIKCGRAGFCGYVSRDASIDDLCDTLLNLAAGRLTCPPEIASGLLSALFKQPSTPDITEAGTPPNSIRYPAPCSFST